MVINATQPGARSPCYALRFPWLESRHSTRDLGGAPTRTPPEFTIEIESWSLQDFCVFWVCGFWLLKLLLCFRMSLMCLGLRFQLPWQSFQLHKSCTYPKHMLGTVRGFKAFIQCKDKCTFQVSIQSILMHCYVYRHTISQGQLLLTSSFKENIP